MTLRASARAMAVGFAAFPVLCPERSSAEVVDVCKLSQQLAALFDKIGVIPSSHPQLRLYPNKGNRHPSENTAFLKFSKSGRAPLQVRRVVLDTKYDIIELMTRAGRLLDSMKANPKADWTPENVRTVVRAHGLTLRQRGTSHAVITNARGRHLTIPMHKPIKPVYIRRLVELIGTAQ